MFTRKSLGGDRRRSLWLALVAAGTLAGVVASVAIAVGQDDDLRPLRPEEVPTPVYNRWIVPAVGVFRAYEWDDRALSSEAKAANPWYDTRWRPFGHCMADAGYEVRTDPGKPFSQRDLDEVVRLANAERPDRSANLRISTAGDVDGIAAAFLSCADQFLTIAYEDLGSRGLRYLNPGEIPEP